MNRSLQRLYTLIDSGEGDDGLVLLYGKEQLQEQKKRYLNLLSWAENWFDETELLFVSAPGRTELGGNHTDHNNGRVLAAAVDLDCVALVSLGKDKSVDLYSEELDHHIRVDLEEMEPDSAELGTPESLVRGVAAALQIQACAVGGFTGIISSTCKPGCGLSSSAAFSVLVGTVFSHFYDSSPVDPMRVASLARYAENVFFGKPCGLMDQVSSAVGGIVGIDFENPEEPIVTRVSTHLKFPGYQLVIVDTGESHAQLTAEYAAIPNEIAQALQVFNRAVARGLSMDDVLNRLPEIRARAGDRALLRLMHFVNEDQRALQQAEALRHNRFSDFLEMVKQSGVSSCSLLQNCVSPAEQKNQGILLALALTAQMSPDSVCRVHGGGFAGTIQTYIPTAESAHYRQFMESLFGDSAVIPVKTGRPGISLLSEKGWFFPTDEA